MSVPTDAVAPRRARVLLTGPVDAQTWHDLSALADVVLAPDAGAETLRRCIADADVLVVRSALPADLLDFAPRLRGIVRHGVGVEPEQLGQEREDEATAHHAAPIAGGRR